MKIWKKSFFHEVWSSSAMCFLVLLGIIALVTFGQLLSVVTGLQMRDILLLSALELVKPLPQIITLSLFGGLMHIFNRMARQRELDAWTTSGLRMRNWFGVVLAMSLPTSAAVGWLALEGVPWSIRTATEYQQALASDVILERSLPGRFGQGAGGKFVYYLGSVNLERTRAGRIFMAAEYAPDRLQVVQAENGVTTDDAATGRSLRLSNGRLHSLDMATGSVVVASFDNASFNYGRSGTQPRLRLRSLSTGELSATDHVETTELYWRLGFPVAVVLLCLFALPSRRGRNPAKREISMLVATLGYYLYYSFTGMFKDLGIHGSLAPWQAAAIPHAIVLFALAVLLARSRSRW